MNWNSTHLPFLYALENLFLFRYLFHQVEEKYLRDVYSEFYFCLSAKVNVPFENKDYLLNNKFKNVFGIRSTSIVHDICLYKKEVGYGQI